MKFRTLSSGETAGPTSPIPRLPDFLLPGVGLFSKPRWSFSDGLLPFEPLKVTRSNYLVTFHKLP